MNKVYDCFQFFNELDILEIRLNELDSQVDHFIIVEAEMSHQFKKKPLYFHENINRFERFLNKIIHIVVPASDFKSNDFWYNERLQRSKIQEGLQKACDGDYVLISDADEIISNAALNYAKQNFTSDAFIFEQNLYHWYLNTRVENQKWINAGITTKKNLQNMGIQAFKNANICNLLPKIKNGGWHFSYIGDEEKIKTKLDNFAHDEFKHLTQEQLKINKDNLIDPLSRNYSFMKFVVDDVSTLPIYVQENIEKFRKIIK